MKPESLLQSRNTSNIYDVKLVKTQSDISTTFACDAGNHLIGHVNNIPTMLFSLELTENRIILSLTGWVEEFEIMHCGILMNMPYY